MMLLLYHNRKHSKTAENILIIKSAGISFLRIFLYNKGRTGRKTFLLPEKIQENILIHIEIL